MPGAAEWELITVFPPLTVVCLVAPDRGQRTLAFGTPNRQPKRSLQRALARERQRVTLQVPAPTAPLLRLEEHQPSGVPGRLKPWMQSLPRRSLC